MEYLSSLAPHALALLTIFFLVVLLSLHLFSLPGNWIILAVVAFWKWAHPEAMTWSFVGVLLLLAVAGEVVEFAAQLYGGKRFGSTGRGNWGGILGTILGAILGAPFFFGLGAVFGALAGAYIGCLALEIGHGRPFEEANRSAWGTLWGRFVGMVVKFGLGVTMIVLALPNIWPG